MKETLIAVAILTGVALTPIPDIGILIVGCVLILWAVLRITASTRR